MNHHSSNLQPFLNRLTSRSVLSDRERRRILDLPVRVKQVRSNEDFVTLGERVDHACFVVDGLVGRFGQNAQGERQITALHIAGDMPDLHSMVQPATNWALQALTTTTLLLVPHASLRAAAAAHPAIAEAFWRDCTVDAGILAQWIVNVGRRDAQSRLAHLLCEMAWRYEGPIGRAPVVYDLPMTQSQLADATGLTPVHVNRTLKRLREIGTWHHGRRVRVEDWDALAAIGEFDPGYLQVDLEPEERLRIVN